MCCTSHHQGNDCYGQIEHSINVPVNDRTKHYNKKTTQTSLRNERSSRKIFVCYVMRRHLGCILTLEINCIQKYWHSCDSQLVSASTVDAIWKPSEFYSLYWRLNERFASTRWTSGWVHQGYSAHWMVVLGTFDYASHCKDINYANGPL